MKTVFTANGTKVSIDEVNQVVCVKLPNGTVIKAGYFDIIETPTGRKTASLFALESFASN